MVTHYYLSASAASMTREEIKELNIKHVMVEYRQRFHGHVDNSPVGNPRNSVTFVPLANKVCTDEQDTGHNEHHDSCVNILSPTCVYHVSGGSVEFGRWDSGTLFGRGGRHPDGHLPGWGYELQLGRFTGHGDK